MTIKRRFMLSYLSSIAVSTFALMLIIGVVFTVTLGEIPSFTNFYKMLTVQRVLTDDENDAFFELNRLVQKSPELLKLPFNANVQTIIHDIEERGLSVVIRKNQGFPYFSNGLIEASLNVHAPEYEFNNFEPIGTLDNAGKLYHYVKNDFHYLDGGSGSFIILSRESSLFELFSKWGTGIIASIISLALLAAIYINRRLTRSTIMPIETLEHVMQLASSDQDIESVLMDFPQQHISKDIEQLQIKFKELWFELKALEALRDADERNRSELISNISHDLKTPITSIIGYIEGLLEGVASTPEKRTHYLQTIHQKAINLNDLIEELFLYSKLEYQELQFDMQVVSVLELLESIVIEYDDETVTLSQVESASTFKAMMDPFHLKRAIINVIENSIKFKDSSRSLIISIKVIEVDPWIIIEIQDNGQGIEREDIDQVFDRFYRGDKSRIASTPGSGLGLGIVKQIIEKHNGHVSISSDYGVGTLVRIKIVKEKES